MAEIGTVLLGGGKRLIFQETSASSGAARLSFDEFLVAGEEPVPSHIRPRQSERFEVLSGTLGLRLGSHEQAVRAGESVVVEPGAAHTYWNAGQGELHHRVTLQPALGHEKFFESVYGLAQEGFTPQSKSLLNLLRLARLFSEHDTWLPGLPMVVRKPLFVGLGGVARLLGVQVWRPQYAQRMPSQFRRRR